MKLHDLIERLKKLEEEMGNVEVREPLNGEYDFEIDVVYDEIFIGN